MPQRLSLLLTFLWLAAMVGQAQPVFTLTADQLQNGQAVELDKLGWKYSPNDDPRFADPQFDDSAWATLASSAKPQDSQSGWRGIGWFRLHLRIAPELADAPLNLELSHLGASEIYLNGKLLRRYGVVGKTSGEETAFNPNALPLAVTFHAETEQIIALRYSNQQTADVNAFLAKWVVARKNEYGGVGFSSRIKSLGNSPNQGYVTRFRFGYDIFQGAVALAFGLLHLLLYFFFSRQRDNLFYSLFLLGLALNNFCLAMFLSVHWGLAEFYLLAVTHWLAGDISVMLLAFLYAAFEQNIPRRLWFFLMAALLDTVLFASPLEQLFSSLAFNFFLLVNTAEMLRIIGNAIRRRQRGAWVIGVGVICMALVNLRDFVGQIRPFYGAWLIATDTIGFYGLMLAISIHLAREFARTNDNLENQLVQVRQLSAAALEHEKVKAENERRAAELEEARQLQLSMLPKKLPELPHLDIAAYMKTATEVGGDYYDFHLGEDGTLTIVVGDATGHGLKAGTLVASIKSLFVSLAYHPDIPHIFQRISTVVKEMKLRGLFMAMTMVKVRGNEMSVSIAGMPSVLIYRAMTKEVEEVAMRALPLGGVTKYQYRQQELTLAANDMVVLMSDGLAERFNPQGEMLDYTRIQQALPALAHQSAEAVIAELLRVGDEWGQGRPQDDDITFVVLKTRVSQAKPQDVIL